MNACQQQTGRLIRSAEGFEAHRDKKKTLDDEIDVLTPVVQEGYAGLDSKIDKLDERMGRAPSPRAARTATARCCLRCSLSCSKWKTHPKCTTSGDATTGTWAVTLRTGGRSCVAAWFGPCPPVVLPC